MQLNSYLIFDGNAREALTFYHSYAFAMLNDRFGVPWMINCGKHLGRENTEQGGSTA